MTRLFQIFSGILVALFVHYGMDIRRKVGARDFVAPFWQVLMKLCSFSLVGAFVWITLSLHQVTGSDWLDFALMTTGTAFVTAAKHALGKAHTFTGQYLEESGLVTRGVYSITRNPLYFGVLQCEVGASLFVLRQWTMSLPQSHVYVVSLLAVALLYAVLFNWIMAMREARYLHSHFGEAYRRYRCNVPFIVPLLRSRKEMK